jgi:hypothetical protein
MAYPRGYLTPAEIALQLDQLGENGSSSDEGQIEVESDDDGLDNLSIDDEDGYDDGPSESQEVVIEPADDLVGEIALTPPPVSPGSQDMFLPSPQPAVTEPVSPQPAVSALEPPARRGRLQTRQARRQPNSGK